MNHTFKLLTALALLCFGITHAQKGKKSDYTPIFEIPNTTSAPFKVPMHAANIGKIVFSDQKLTLENTNESLLKTSFNLGDKIYGRIFLSNSVGNYMLYRADKGQTKEGETKNIRHGYFTIYYVDGVELTNLRGDNHDYGSQDRNTWQIFPNGDAGDSDLEYAREKLNQLAPGPHTMKVEVWAGETSSYPEADIRSIKPLASGEFTLNVGANSKLKIGKSWTDYKEATSMDAKITAEAKKMFTDHLKLKQPNMVIKAIKNTNKDWSIHRDKYNQIEYRSLNVVAYVQDSQGKCWVYWGLYTQDYAGGGNYSTVLKKWGDTPTEEIDCE